jgi:hypothetical protein
MHKNLVIIVSCGFMGWKGWGLGKYNFVFYVGDKSQKCNLED